MKRHSKKTNKILEKVLAHKYILIILLIFFLIQLFFLTTKYYLPDWDDSVYLGMGKYIYSTGHSGLWETFRPLGIPVLIGFGWALGLRDNSYILFSQMIAILFSAGILIMIYLIAKKLFGKNVAVFSALIIILTPVFLKYSNSVLTDIPSAFLILVSIYFILRQKYFIAGLFSGLSFLFKFPQGLFVLSFLIFAFYLILRNRRESFRIRIITFFKIIKPFLIAFILVILPYLIFNLIHYNLNAYNQLPNQSMTTYSIFDAIFTPLSDASKFQNNPFLNTNITNISSLIYYIFFYPIQLVRNNFLYSLFLLYLILFFIPMKKIKSTSKLKNKNSINMLIKNKDTKNNLSNYDVNSGKIFLLINLLIFFIYFSIIPLKQDRFVIFFAPIISIFVSFTGYSIFYFLTSLFDAKNMKNLKRYFIACTLFLFLVLIIFSFVIASAKIIKDYSIKSTEEPLIVTEYYRYFENNGIKGTILTSDPILAAYNENKFIEFFNEFSDRINLAKENNSINTEKITAIVYVDYAFPCLAGNLTCPEMHKAYFNDIYANNRLIFNTTYFGNNYYIFSTKN